MSDGLCIVDFKMGESLLTYIANRPRIIYDEKGNLSYADYDGHCFWCPAENVIEDQSSPECEIITMNNNIVLTINRQWDE